MTKTKRARKARNKIQNSTANATPNQKQKLVKKHAGAIAIASESPTFETRLLIPSGEAARPTLSPLEELDMNILRLQHELNLAMRDMGSISCMAVSESSDTDYASVGHGNHEEDSEAESTFLLPELPENADGGANAPSLDSDASDSSSDFSFDVAFEPGQKKTSTPAAAADAGLTPKVVRPPPIFIHDIEDLNSSLAKKPRLDLGAFKLPAAAVVTAAATSVVTAGPAARVSEEALASLSITHIASDLFKYFVRTRGPKILQRFVAPSQAAPEDSLAAASPARSATTPTPALSTIEEAFGFGSPVDNIVREPAPWEAFGSPLELAARLPAPWEVDPLSAPLPDDEEIVEEDEENWAEMVHPEWHEDVATSTLDVEAMKKEWNEYCAERLQKIQAMLGKEEDIAAAEATFEAAKIVFKELGATASISIDNKRKLSSDTVPFARLTHRNLIQNNRSENENLITQKYLDGMMSVTNPIKRRFLEADYCQQVWRRFTPTAPGFGTGLGIALEYPTSENSQRDGRLAEQAAAQAMFYFNHSCVECVRPPVKRTRDEVEVLSALAKKNNPAQYLKSGVIITREADGAPFHCNAGRPPLDLAISQSRKRGSSFKKRIVSDVWQVPPSPPPPEEDTVYHKVLDKAKEVNYWKGALYRQLNFTYCEFCDKLKAAAGRLHPSSIIVYWIFGL